jgi:hypothetical protein
MEKFRLKQAESLLKAATKNRSKDEKLNAPKEGTINVDIYEYILNTLIEAEEFIYSSRPSHTLDQENAEIFIGKLIETRKGIDEILSDFGVIDKINPEEDIKEYSKDLLILTTKNSFKKTITKFGVDPQKIVVAGVPLDPDDMKILNPKLPETALNSIEKKITHVKNDIERKMDQFNLKNIIVLVENDESGNLLGTRAKKLYNAKLVTFDNLKDINADEFIKIVS